MEAMAGGIPGRFKQIRYFHHVAADLFKCLSIRVK